MKKLWSQVRRKNWILCVAIVALLIISGVGVTYAYNQHNTELDNMLRASSVAGEIIENENPAGESNEFELKPGKETSKRVRFKNTGEADVFVRVAFSERWTDKDGNWLVNIHDYTTLHWTSMWQKAWELKNDGWYYYKEILPSKAMTEEVLSSVGFAPDDELLPEYQTGNYRLLFTMEVLQASGEAAVNYGALEKAFGRTATVTDGVVTWN
jgi:hypothetical protein